MTALGSGFTWRLPEKTKDWVQMNSIRADWTQNKSTLHSYTLN